MAFSRHTETITPSQVAIDEAAEWIAEAADGDLDLERRQEFGRWLRRSPENIAAYFEVAAFWSEVPQAAPPGAFEIAKLLDEARAEANVVPLSVARGPLSTARVSPTVYRSFGRHRIAVAAVAILAISAGIWGVQFLRGETIATAIGEQRSVTLSDGSTVELNARTHLRVRMSDKTREVTLEDGQALFSVAKDSARPFIVHSGDVQIRAVGTQFDVDRRTTRTTVTVLEGRVAVGATSDVPVVELPAGQRLVARGANFAPPEKIDPSSATAWTDRRLVFQATPLSEVIEDFNRFSRKPIIVEDPVLAGLAISGVYTSTDPSSLILFLRAQPGIQVEETSSRILITVN